MTPIRILFVEDNAYLRESMAELMEAPGREITACGSADDAMAQARAQRFDVLITDISLGSVSGTDLARALLAEHPEHWVVFCSGYPLPPDLTMFGPNVRSLAKPFEMEELDALLAALGNGPQPA
jgi:two-component system, cell cycle response regulator CpdR